MANTVESLFGEEFTIKIPQVDTKKIVQKIDNKQRLTADAEKVLKSKKISLRERLAVINSNVLRVLGKQKQNVLVIKDRETFDTYIDNAIKAGRIAIDTETNNSLDPVTCKLMGPCLYYPGGKQAYIPLNHRDPDTKERLPWQLTEEDCREEFQRIIDTKTLVIMHNGKFDYEVIKCTCGIAIKPDWDTMIAARLLNENELAGLKYQYTTKIDRSQEKYDIEKLFENVAYADVNPDIFALYAAHDAAMTDALYELQKAEMDKDEYGPHLDMTGTHEIKGLRWLFHEVEMPIVVVTAEMELRGVKIDTAFGERLKQKYNNQLAEIDQQINDVLQELKPVVAAWRTAKDSDANEKTRTYVPKKTKMSAEKIELQYPLVDEDGNRYKISKSKSEQLEEEINLASPVQLGILFYDVLGVKAVSKKSPRGTGKDELTAISEMYKAALDTAAIEINDEVEETDDETTMAEEDYVENKTLTEAEKQSLKAIAAAKLSKLILTRRGIAKLVTTYIDVIPDLAKHWPDGRIRFHLNSLGTDTGRYSSGGKLKFMENDEPIVVSGINIQNIPSHNPEIRMLFTAPIEYHKVELDGEYYSIPETDEVETIDGWKKVKALQIGDVLIGEDNQDTVRYIEKRQKIYYIYI